MRSGPQLQCLCESAILPFSSAFTLAVASGNVSMASTAAVYELDESVASLQREVVDAIADLRVRIDVIHSLASRAQQICHRLALSIERLEFRLRVLEQIADNTDLVDPLSTEGSLHSLD